MMRIVTDSQVALNRGWRAAAIFRDLPIQIKTRIYLSILRPIALYDHEQFNNHANIQ